MAEINFVPSEKYEAANSITVVLKGQVWGNINGQYEVKHIGQLLSLSSI